MDESISMHGLDFTTVEHPEEGRCVMVRRNSDGIRVDTFAARLDETLTESVERYVRLRLGSEAPVTGVCLACRTPLEAVFPGMSPGSQYHNALEVRFGGGYGMFIDPFDGEDPYAVICHDCAHALCESAPWIKTLLDPTWSHSH
jgi:hypothetical protein